MSITLNGTSGITTPGLNNSGALAGTTGTFSGLISANGGQIAFPATQNPSSDANTLDDYEEGTWTPVIAPSSGSITSYSSAGWYIKIGRSVTISGYFNLTNAGTGSGVCNLSSLPFTVANASFPSGNRNAIGVCREDAITGQLYQLAVQGGTTTGIFQALTGSNISYTTGYVYVFTITYEASA
jgi:hypothetical protein